MRLAQGIGRFFFPLQPTAAVGEATSFFPVGGRRQEEDFRVNSGWVGAMFGFPESGRLMFPVVNY
jgi:hypothetical protein